MADPGERRCGFVAVAGAPNAGKSTLVNRLVGAKVSIVSPKVQTTRQRLVGIAMAGDSQILLVDTPGVFVGAKRRLEKAMVAGAWAGVADADLVLLVVDAGRGGRAAAEPLIERLAAGPAPPVLLALNKIDLVPRPSLLDLARDLNERLGCVATFMISATKGDGVDDLKRDLARRVPAGPWHYPDDQAADLPLRRLAAELTREQLFLKLHDELPYAVAVDTEQWQERDDGSVRIEQTVAVMRDGQRAIVLGEGGRTIRAIGSAARRAIAAAIDRPVHLFLHVEVRAGWVEDRARLRDMGIDVG